MLQRRKLRQNKYKDLHLSHPFTVLVISLQDSKCNNIQVWSQKIKKKKILWTWNWKLWLFLSWVLGFFLSFNIPILDCFFHKTPFTLCIALYFKTRYTYFFIVHFYFIFMILDLHCFCVFLFSNYVYFVNYAPESKADPLYVRIYFLNKLILFAWYVSCKYWFVN